MKKMVLVGLLLSGLLFGSPRTAYASVLDWPVVSQVSNVVRCVIADSGAILSSLVTHATAFTKETLTTVGECLLYTTQQVTPGLVSDPAAIP